MIPMAREGWPYILSSLTFGVGLWLLGFPGSAGVFVALAAFTAFFFRDPERVVPSEPGLVLSPADGRIVKVVPTAADHPLGPGASQVSIFLSIFDVHVNRSPIGGRIAGVEYHAGEFLPAFDDKASLRNEQNTVTVESGGTRVIFKQIAGLIARRIVFRKRVDEQVRQGERVGLIKFGSRVDVFLPREFRLLVKVGDRVRGGASVLADRS